MTKKWNVQIWAATLAFGALVVLFFTACAHTPLLPKECQELDWYELGRQDGTKGLDSHGRRKVSVICEDSDQSLSEALYNNGFDAGIYKYCTPRSGFELGRKNAPFVESLCPPLLRTEFIRRYRQGQRSAEIENQQKEISRRIQGLNERLEDKSSEIARRGLLKGERLELQEKSRTLEVENNSLKMETHN